jgi:hypothetical protein
MDIRLSTAHAAPADQQAPASRPPATTRRRTARLAVAAFGLATAVLSAVPATLLAAAPAANATATRIGVDADMNYGLGTNYGTGCQYTVEVAVTDGAQPVQVFDNNAPIGWFRPTGAQAIVPWTPATAGPHRITAVQAGTPPGAPTPYVDLRVADGLHMGNNCAVVG